MPALRLYRPPFKTPKTFENGVCAEPWPETSRRSFGVLNFIETFPNHNSESRIVMGISPTRVRNPKHCLGFPQRRFGVPNSAWRFPNINSESRTRPGVSPTSIRSPKHCLGFPQHQFGVPNSAWGFPNTNSLKPHYEDYWTARADVPVYVVVRPKDGTLLFINATEAIHTTQQQPGKKVAQDGTSSLLRARAFGNGPLFQLAGQE
jgi:hypothetical protein